MKKSALLVAIALVSYAVRAQNADYSFQKRNSIQLSTGGREDFFVPLSIQYERILFQGRHLAWNMNVGGMWQPLGNSTQKVAILDFGTVSLGEKHHWEAGTQVMLQDKRSVHHYNDQKLVGKSASWYTALRVGYRHQPVNDKWLVRINALFPVAYDSKRISWSRSYKIQNVLIPWPTVSVGRAF